MMKTVEAITVNPSESLDKTRQTISDELRSDFEDWMTASQDLVLRPLIELTQEDNEFAARTLVSGADSKSVQVLVEPERLLIKGEMYRKSGRRKFLCSANFPRPVDPGRVHAEFNDGMISVRAEIAERSKVIEYVPRAA